MTRTGTQDVLDVVAADWRPSRVESRRAIVAAINATASAHHGLVHAATIREHLPSWVHPSQVGAVVCALVRTGHLTPTGRYRPNNDTASRNRAKPSEVRRLTKPIQLDTLK